MYPPVACSENSLAFSLPLETSESPPRYGGLFYLAYVKRSYRAFAPSLPSNLGRHLQETTDGAVTLPVLIPLGDTEHGYGHLRGSIGVGG